MNYTQKHLREAVAILQTLHVAAIEKMLKLLAEITRFARPARQNGNRWTNEACGSVSGSRRRDQSRVRAQRNILSPRVAR